MKSNLTILIFFTLLTDLANGRFSFLNLSQKSKEFNEFSNRLQESIKESDDILPFKLKVNVIESLKETSSEFKFRCIQNEVNLLENSGTFSPVNSLNQTINQIFHEWIESTEQNRDKLEEIKSVDPIGFIAYLTKRREKMSSPTITVSINQFLKVMRDRVRLFKCKTDNSCIEFFDNNPDKIVHEIPDHIREPVASEYQHLYRDTVDFFIKFAMEQLPHIKMYYLDAYDSVKNFMPHKSKDKNDVQIVYTGGLDRSVPGHVICMVYNATIQKVQLYDSAMKIKFSPKLWSIIYRLYPYNKGISIKRPVALQGNSETCAIFSTYYATMSFLGQNPAKDPIKLNNVYGDKTLYMRLHILNMLANQKLALMSWTENE